ncbi:MULTISPECIES: hypothetical protein [Brevibacillus]|uniref:hypothetical protein n=1 Tax=Brevibacillus TaxID=55080 RepID=UPI000271AADB|nr:MULTISPECIES: hypothetical protein [Brevibacillus]ELK40069.1 hypothetical protein D478_21191 [Brevibacillus agri BAB-2500]EJL40871.1 hypothetical protein PMI08_04014 [Brevibacillus sp. CF112]MDN4091365.1 hypothetical protein [Brevibacillus agri]MDR9502921.1 hypothetical protein [Brevibacillus agri]MED1823851.1 hypothetical protein [Brevibacillus agri]
MANVNRKKTSKGLGKTFRQTLHEIPLMQTSSTVERDWVADLELELELSESEPVNSAKPSAHAAKSPLQQPLQKMPKQGASSNQTTFSKIIKERNDDRVQSFVYTDDLTDQSVTTEKIANRAVDSSKTNRGRLIPRC